MGVHGLATYLRENHQSLSQQLHFDGTSPSVTNLIVDAFSFIHELVDCSNLDWVYGGEYDQFSRLVVSVVQGWISVGLKLYFVFDGPSSSMKSDTVISRLTEDNVKASLLFFRTSSSSRSTPRFLNESRILPPLSANVCVEALRSVARSAPQSLEIHFAPEDGDLYAVDLAGKVNGYVTGQDPDFVILNTEGYKGYIPMGEFLWYSSLDASETASQVDDESDFRPVRRRRKAKQQASTNLGIIPPQDLSNKSLALSCSAYAPSDLAAYLDIPVSLLPLLAALVGDDSVSFRRNSAQSMFFDHKVSSTQRITLVSTTLLAVLVPSSGPKRKQKQVNSVMDLVRRTVLALFIRDASHVSVGEQESIIEKVVESTLQYAIPKREERLSEPSGPPCLLHGTVGNLLPTSLSGLPDNPAIRKLYNTAYCRGHLFSNLVRVIHSGEFWPMPFLENPDVETVSITIGRPIREWIYAILDDGVGLPEKEEPQPSEPSEPYESEDEDELVDVVEEYSSDEDEELVDPLAPLRGALERLEGDSTPAFAPPSPIIRKPRFVNEYVRCGTRVAPEEISVTLLSTLLAHLPTSFATPVQLMPGQTRFRLLLSILSSDSAIESIQALPQERVIPVLAIRSVLKILYERWAHSPTNRDRLKERWTKREVKALLLAFIGPSDPEFPDGAGSPPPEILDRHVQLTAQIFTALESVILLVQVLLLNGELLPLTLVSRFSGRRFHVLLNRGVVVGPGTIANGFVDEGVPSELWTSVVAGFDDDVFVEERMRKARKVVKSVKKEQKQTVSTAKRHFNTGMYGLLADVEA